MLDATTDIKDRVKEVRHVSGSEDVRQGRLKIPINNDTVADFDAAPLQEFDIRRHSDRDKREIARQGFSGTRPLDRFV